MTELNRINFLIARDGLSSTIEWIKRTIKIYRQAVLNKNHFASTREYRPKFIQSYVEFKLFLWHN